MVRQENMDQQGMWRMITCVTSFVLRVQTFRYPGNVPALTQLQPYRHQTRAAPHGARVQLSRGSV